MNFRLVMIPLNSRVCFPDFLQNYQIGYLDTLVYLLLDNVSESCDMQNRSTILLLLFTVTLAVGALTLWQSSNDNEAVERFRSLFSTSAVYDLQNSLPSVTDQASLLYGGIALLAIIVIVLALRAAWRDSSRSPKNG
jgi:uncharacterized membrane protein